MKKFVDIVLIGVLAVFIALGVYWVVVDHPMYVEHRLRPRVVTRLAEQGWDMREFRLYRGKGEGVYQGKVVMKGGPFGRTVTKDIIVHSINGHWKWTLDVPRW